MADAKRDNNQVPTMIAVSNADGVTPVVLYADPVTHRLLVSLPAGAGTVTTVSVVTANGISGSVANADTTPAITLTLGAITPTSVNGLTLTALATGFSIAGGTTSKTLTVDETKNLSDKADKTYVDGLVVGLLDYRGAYDASGNAFPATGGSGTAGAILKGDMFIISVAGTLGGEAVQIGDSIIANEDSPGQTASKWDKLNANISYVPEDSANKVTSISGSSTDVQYASAKCVYDNLQNYVTKALFDANTILAANSDNTPAALTVAEQTLVGRITGGNIAALTIAQIQALIFGTALSTEILLGENFGIKYDAALSADGKYSGAVRAGTAGAALAFGDLVYLAAADSRWELTDANVAGTAGDVMLGMCVLAANADGDATTILMQGFIRADAAFPTMTISAPVYVSETAGDIVVAQPTTTDVVIRRVGFAWTADELYFNPSNDYITHT